MNDPLIRIQNISKTFKIWNKPADMFMESVTGRVRHTEFQALDEVSFDVMPGQIVGILGRNGAGKSTLLKIISGTLDATSGKVDVNGRISAILELGTGFHHEYTGRENVYLGGMCLGMSRSEVESKFDEIVAFAELEEFIDRPFRTYSTGMQARLTFSVATSLDPDVLIVDEALAVGDAKFALKSFDRIRNFSRQNKAILLVTHNISQVMSFCDHAIVLERGNVVASGDPAKVGNIYHRILFDEDLDFIPPSKDELVTKENESIQHETIIEQEEEIITAHTDDVINDGLTLPDESIDFPEGNFENRVIFNATEQAESLPNNSNDEVSTPQEEQKKIRSVVEELSAEENDSTTKTDGAEDEVREVRYGDKKAVIKDIFILDKKGQKQTWLNTLESYEFVIEIHAYEDCPDLNMGLLIRTHQGVDVFGADSIQRTVSVETDLKAGEQTKCRIQWRNNLAPGHYFATLSLARVDSHKHDLRFDAFEFIVAPTPGIYDASMANIEIQFKFDSPENG